MRVRIAQFIAAFAFMLVIAVFNQPKAYASDFTVEQWNVVEIELTAVNTYADPFNDVDVTAVFTGPGSATITRPAFWDGGSTWKIRFAPTELGTWTMTTQASDPTDAGLHNVSKTIDSEAYTGDLEIYERGFLKVGSTGRYMTYADGTPFFYLGDTHWVFPHERFSTSNVTGVASQFKYTVDKRVGQGFTVYQSEPIWQPHAGGTHSDPDEEEVANLRDGLTAADLPGFENLDRKFKYIADKGVVHANAQVTWSADPANFPVFTEAYMGKVARYWVARYGAYPVIWTIAQEVDKNLYGTYDGTTIQKWFAVGQSIEDNDDYNHPIMPHMEITSSVNPATSWWANKSYHDGWAAQWQNDMTGMDTAKAYWSYTPAKPAVVYESAYENFWTDARGALGAAYKSFQYGMYGYGYGAAGVWNDIYSKPGEPDDFGTAYEMPGRYYWWYDGANLATGDQLTYFKNFYASLEWWKLVPRFDDTAWADFGDHTKSLLSSDGNNTYVVFFFNGGKSTGTLKQMDLGSVYRAKWFNPRTGQYTAISNSGQSAAGEWAIPPKPTSEDWVLLVEKWGSLSTMAGPPHAEPATTVFSRPIEVVLSTLSAGAAIYYTTDGTAPTSSSTLYTGPIALTGTTTLKAIAVKAGVADSPVVEEIYTFTNNLARGRTYASSTYWDGNQMAENAFDGDVYTNWQASPFHWVGEWLEVDFGENTTFNKVVLTEYNNRTQGYRIEYWDGSSWHTAYTGTTIGSLPTTPLTVTFDEVTGSKARIYYTDGVEYAPVIYEFEIYYDPANLARSGMYSSSSAWDVNQLAAKAFDGNPGTHWQACNGCWSGEWLQVDFGVNKTFNKVVLSEYDNRTKGYRIEYWDGSSWQTAYTGTTIGALPADPLTVTFDEVTGSKARIYFTAGMDYAPIIYEFEIYYEPGNAVAPSVPTKLVLQPGNGSATLIWRESTWAESYNIKRGTAPGGPYSVIASNVIGTEYTDTTVTNGTTYYYVVSAVNAYGESGNSAEESVTPSTDVNLSIGRTYASSSSWDGNQTAVKAFDGSLGTNWQACLTCWNGEWLEVNFGAFVTFDKVVLTEYDNRTQGYRIEYWTGTSWQTAYTGTTIGASLTPLILTFSEVTGSKARIYFTSGTSFAPIIYEFQVYDT